MQMNFFVLPIVALVIVWSSRATAGYDDDTTTPAPEPTTTVAPEPTTTVAPTTAKPFNDCPEGWVYAGKLGCLYFNTDKHKAGLSWIDAQGECEILGGFLAEVKTQEEHAFLKSE